uniref:Uncharacterized protein n=1 Tax=Hucho hucho TaxID=62062 RepID=A0A4W5RI99_9TELE
WGGGANILCFITLVILFLWRVYEITEACTCMIVHPQQAFCNADIGKANLATFHTSRVSHHMLMGCMFKCPNQVIHAIFTESSPAACGVTPCKLETGRMYVTRCGYNPPWEDLSAMQKKSLTHRYQSGCDCKIIHCTSLPCPISTTDACLWMDWGTNNGQNLACIKSDGSCAWK